MTTPRMEIVWRVLERAIDAEDWEVIEACRRLVIANRLGWRRYTNASDWNLVMAFDDLAAPAASDLIHDLDEQDGSPEHQESRHECEEYCE